MPFNPTRYISCEEQIDTTSGNPMISGGSRRYTRRWHVIVSERGFGAAAVCSCPLLPKPYSIYQSFNGVEFDTLAVLVDYQAQRKESDEYYHWIVTATYSTEVPEGGIPALTLLGTDTNGSQNKPWDERPILQWDWDETHEAPPRDLDGRAYVNSAKMPFVPAPSFPAARNVLEITRNEPSFSRDIAKQYCYAVNADTFLGADPGTVRSNPVRVKQKNRGPLQYYEVKYRLVFNLPEMPAPLEDKDAAPLEGREKEINLIDKLQSWQPEILDQGTHQLQKIAGVPFSDRPVPIWRYGGPVSHPVLLDGLGKEQLPNAKGIIVPKYLKFRRYHGQPFTKIIEKGIFGGF